VEEGDDTEEFVTSSVTQFYVGGVTSPDLQGSSLVDYPIIEDTSILELQVIDQTNQIDPNQHGSSLVDDLFCSPTNPQHVIPDDSFINFSPIELQHIVNRSADINENINLYWNNMELVIITEVNTDLELDQITSGVNLWGSSDVSNIYSGGTENLSESIFNLQNRQVLNINPSLRLPDRVNFNTNVQNIRQICENITDEDIEYCGNINNMIRDT